MSKLTTCLWFDGQAEEAAAFYTELLPESRLTGEVERYPEGSPQAGAVMTVGFELLGQPFVGLNGGPLFTFNEAVSFVIPCTTQAEVDRYWEALTEGGSEQPCGWCKDRFGLSWQVVPARLMELLRDPDGGRAQRAAAAMMGMKKIDIAALEAAADAGGPVDPSVFAPMGGEGS
jgi:predicted 3-demethylubiquinone-9 3-methyltransferase (glyoxalase superfamily)